MKNVLTSIKEFFSNITVWIVLTSLLIVGLGYVCYDAYIAPRIPGRPHFEERTIESREQVYDRRVDFDLLDTDNDEHLSVDEYYGLTKLHGDMDINNDGMLSWEEAEYMMTFAEVPAGEFMFGTNDDFKAFFEPPGDQGPEIEVYLDSYLMAKTELTTAQYVMYLNSALEAGEITVTEVESSNIADERFYRDVPAWGVFGAPGTTYEYEPFTLLVQAGSLSHNVNEISTTLIPEHPYNQAWIYYHPETESFHVHLGMEDMPAAYIQWWGGMAFAEYYELSLPTEAEWEKASKGGMDYDYGTVDGTNDCDVSNHGCYNAMNVLFFDGVNTPEKYIGFRIDVGSYEANPYGIYDLAGNVWEWTLDEYRADVHSYFTDNNIYRNPLSTEGEQSELPPAAYDIDGYLVYKMGNGILGGPSVTLSHKSYVTRGGSYNYSAPVSRSEWRMPTYQFIGNDHFGVRFVLRPDTTEFNQTN